MTWYKGTDTAGNMIYHKGAAHSGYLLAISGGKAKFHIEGPTDVHDIALFSTAVINNNEWHQIAAVRNYATRKLLIYVDEIEKSMTDTTTDCSHSVALALGGNAYSTGFASGILDDVRIYNRVLPAEEILKLYNLFK